MTEGAWPSPVWRHPSAFLPGGLPPLARRLGRPRAEEAPAQQEFLPALPASPQVVASWTHTHHPPSPHPHILIPPSRLRHYGKHQDAVRHTHAHGPRLLFGREIREATAHDIDASLHNYLSRHGRLGRLQRSAYDCLALPWSFLLLVTSSAFSGRTSAHCSLASLMTYDRRQIHVWLA